MSRVPRLGTMGLLTRDVMLHVQRFADNDAEVSVQSLTEHRGGSAANTAAGAAAWGVAAYMLGCTSSHAEGQRITEVLAQSGVNVDWMLPVDAPPVTVFAIVDGQGQRRLYTHAAPSAALTPELLTADRWQYLDAVHLCTLGAPFLQRAVQLKKQYPDTILSVDPGNLVIHGPEARELLPLLQACDYVFLNLHEVRTLMGATTSLQAETWCQQYLPTTVLLKQGADGFVWVEPGVAAKHFPGYPIDCVDSTGAGDAFAAGFLATSLLEQTAEFRALVANACGAIACCIEGCEVDLAPAKVMAFLHEHGINPSEFAGRV